MVHPAPVFGSPISVGKSEFVSSSISSPNVDGRGKDMPSTAGCAAVSAANAAAIGAADLQDNSSGDPQHPLSTVAGTRGPVGESAGVKECGFDCRAAVGVDQAKEEGQDRSAEQAGQDAVLREKSTTANATAAATTTTEVIAASAPAHGEGDGSQATTFAADAVAPDTGAATAAVAAASDDVPLGAEQMAISLLLPTEAAAGLAEKLGSGSERTGIVGVDEAEENRTEYQGRRLLQLAEGALARLYETHDNYFCSDRDEKKNISTMPTATELCMVPSTRRASNVYKATLTSARVKTFSTIIAQQCPAGLNPVLLSFNTSGSIIRFLCGHNTPNGISTKRHFHVVEMPLGVLWQQRKQMMLPHVLKERSTGLSPAGHCWAMIVENVLTRAERRLEADAQEVMEALSRVGSDVGGTMNERARVSYIRGRTLDAFSDFNPEAEKCLARAVKLQPSEPDNWTALGHCYWKKPDLFAAKRCFLTSLEKVKKADTMRQLSMLLRQLPATAQEANDNLQESLRLAKEAVTLDMGCGDSWYVLGNAYVASFFKSSRGIKNLDRALQAYKKAESTGGGGNPDLFFNRAHVLHYREDYPEAIRDYRVARELDPLLLVESALNSIEIGVKRLAKLVESKGGLKARRLSQLVSSLRGKSVRRGLDEGIRLVGLKELRIGRNMGVAVALKVMMPAEQSAQPPERLVVVDHSGECAVLSLYSVSKEACEKIQSKDTLVVNNPSFRTIFLGASPQPPPPARPVTAGRAEAPLDDSTERSLSVDNGVKGDDTVPITIVQSNASTGNPSPRETPAPPAVTAGEGGEAGSTSPGHSESGSETKNSAGSQSDGGACGKSGAAAAEVATPPDGCRTPNLGVGESGAASASTAAAITTGAAVSTISYTGIQCDPSEVLLNGETMKRSFVPPSVRLATFDK